MGARGPRLSLGMGTNMELQGLSKHFAAMGGRVKFRPFAPPRRWRREAPPRDGFAIDIRRDREGEYFDFAVGTNPPEFQVLQVVPQGRHLLLRAEGGRRFLCGHDERHWFVAAIGGRVSTVRDAKRSLVPEALRAQVEGQPPAAVDNRRNAIF